MTFQPLDLLAMRFTGAKAVQNIIAGRVLIDVRVGKSLCTTFAAYP
jgi:hypothetical protein